jgi:acyl-CoA synthetase (AMP-forming)/AMP-acid ligase II
MVGFKSKASEIEYIMNNSEARCLMFHKDFSSEILPCKENYKHVLKTGFISFGGSCEGAINFEDLFTETPDIDLNKLPPAVGGGESMTYTSGTTGKPKGAFTRAGEVDLEAAVRYLMHSMAYLKYGSDEVHLLCCPIYHSAPSYFAALAFNSGGTIVFQRKFDPEKWYELVSRYGVTSSHIVPTMLYALLEVPKSFTDDLNLSSLRSVACGAAPLSPKAKLEALDRFGPVFYEYYGSTETALNTFIGPDEIPKKPASVGKAFGENEIRLVDENGNDVPDGEPGILYVHNAVCASGYYKNTEASDEIRLGKFITAGDIAVRDEDGYYYIVDRIKDMIIRGGVNIYPAEIEKTLNDMPEIKDAAVVGHPDDYWGEIVAAFIVVNRNMDINEKSIRQYCEERMAKNKVPALIHFIDEMPRTPTGKILKRELRDVLAEKRS